MSTATNLVAVQRALQRHLLNPALEEPEFVQGDSADRIDIYATAYRLRLQDALAANFPMLQIHLGAERFIELSARYLNQHPSNFVSIRSFGDQLPAWLAANHAVEPWLAEFARFEWALGSAFDASDMLPVAPEALSTVALDEWSRLRFDFSPATQRLALHTNAAELYRRAADVEPAIAGCAVAEPVQWLIWRRALLAQYRSIEPPEAVAIDTLVAGGSFADMCEALSQHVAEDDVPLQAAALLKRWLIDELVVGWSAQT